LCGIHKIQGPAGKTGGAKPFESGKALGKSGKICKTIQKGMENLCNMTLA